MTDVITSSYMIKLDFCGKTYLFSDEETKGFIKGLLATMDKSSIVFKNIVVSRAHVEPLKNENQKLTLGMTHIGGSYNYEELLATFNFQGSNKDWGEYVKGIIHLGPQRAKL